jgi:hypothetical protein
MRSLFYILPIVLVTQILAFEKCQAQSFKITLSPNHDKKLQAVRSGHKRIVKYNKYYKKDSAEFRKGQNKKAIRSWDSLVHADNNNRKLVHALEKRGIKGEQQIAYGEKVHNELRHYSAILEDSASSDSAIRSAKKRLREISKDKITSQLAKSGHPYATQIRETDLLRQEMASWWKIMRDTSSSDSLRSVAKVNVKDLAIKIAGKKSKTAGNIGALSPGRQHARLEIALKRDAWHR